MLAISNARRFARQHIYFREASPISGQFNDERYPFLGPPLDSLDNIRLRQTTVYKGASCLGTVFSQIAMAYRLSCRFGNMLFVAQSEPDAKEWMVTRGKSFLMSIKPLTTTLSGDKYAVTNQLMRWPHQYLIISGPGENAQQSKQVTYLHTDEAHVYDPGVMSALDDRMGARWNRHALHTSTASNEATQDEEGKPVMKEIDLKYHEGDQQEWHQGCIHCGKLIWPLWEQYAIDHYNGERVFVWEEKQSDNWTLDTVRMVCPHCNKEIHDQPKIRREMNTGGGYVPQRLDNSPENASFRWSRLAPDWIQWREVLSSYLKAMKAAKSGDLSQMENFTKKWLCMTWKGYIPDLMDAYVTGDYNLGEPWTS